MSSALVVAIAWFALVLAAAAAHRPAPRRLRNLVPTAPPRSGRSGGTSLSTTIGNWVLRRLGRDEAPLPARRIGAAILGGLALLPLSPVAAGFGALTGWGLPALRQARRERHRLAALVADLPETVDLLALAVSSGLTVRLALEAVVTRASGPLVSELATVVKEVAVGRRLADALDDVPGRAGDAIRPLIGALVASERYGAPLSATLDRLACEVRADRRRRAEEAARKVPVKLLFPLVSCTLPAFALLTVAPLIASAVRSLRP